MPFRMVQRTLRLVREPFAGAFDSVVPDTGAEQFGKGRSPERGEAAVLSSLEKTMLGPGWNRELHYAIRAARKASRALRGQRPAELVPSADVGSAGGGKSGEASITGVG